MTMFRMAMDVPQPPDPSSAWVRAILKRHRAALAEAAGGPGLLPPQGPRGAIEVYGCGSFGCVMPTEDPGVVFKVTSDPNEAGFVAAWLRQHHDPYEDPGVVRYRGVVRLPEMRRGRPVYALWRESAEKIGSFGDYYPKAAAWVSSLKVIAGLLRDVALRAKDRAAVLGRAADMTGRVRVPEALTQHGFNHRSIVEALAPYRGPTRAAVCLAALESIAIMLSNTPGGDRIGDELYRQLGEGMVLCDVHLNNIGLVTRAYVEQWVITDPGHALLLDDRHAGLTIPDLADAAAPPTTRANPPRSGPSVPSGSVDVAEDDQAVARGVRGFGLFARGVADANASLAFGRASAVARMLADEGHRGGAELLKIRAAREPRVAYLRGIEVPAAARRRGIGGALLDAAIDLATRLGADALYLHAVPGKDVNRSVLAAFYASRGMTIDAIDVFPMWRRELSRTATVRRANPPPTTAMRGHSWWHGTSSEALAQRVLAEGLRPRDLTLAKPPRSRGMMAPVPGKVYLSPEPRYATIYALGGVWMGTEVPSWVVEKNGRYGYLFEVRGEDLVDVEPDEDAVGEAFHDAHRITRGLAAGDGPVAKALARDRDFATTLAATGRSLVTERQWRGIVEGHYPSFAAGGKRALKKLPAWMRLRLLEYGANVAHGGSLPIARAWRIDRDLAPKIKRDASNVFDLAERVR